MFKRILRWLILGGTLFFVAKTLKDNWLEVAAIRIDSAGWAILAIATGITLLAHIWAGWVWTWVLKELNQPVPVSHFIQVYLKTNVAKYLPGNVWHHYGRILAAKEAKIPTVTATVSILLEPLLMATAALIIIVLLGSQFTSLKNDMNLRILQALALIAILCAFYPRFLNPILNSVQKLKFKKAEENNSNNSTNNYLKLERYPLIPLFGELAFLILRGMGFILTLFALVPLQPEQIPLLLGAFSFAWLLGFVIPGAPGGLGVFEATTIALLQGHFPPALAIGGTVLYRLVSILAETFGAGIAWLEQRCEEEFKSQE
ncbi:YbhN family protein [Calothrix sp. UHCC 0171]|uniref:lysylphosphatidylglycerol synthase transmembrane domain-containing protein n=1 Tax=Calothrix sp. UHCC 0171 TaxID=3110245 RepID=UPI002B1F0C42|nr:YbhN family protein [Calothrix sp. UHCC 0171]MEA5572881.1 YbhN family protein [Calothrix sp. UHCC 0171]